MVLTATDLLRVGLTLGIALLAYGRLSNVLRFLAPRWVRHRALPELPETPGPLAEALQAAGFRYLGGRTERVLGLHPRIAQVYADEHGRVLDVPLSGRLAGGYLMTVFEDGRCALTRCGAGRDVEVDRYRSRAVGPGRSLRDLLELHAETEASLSLGQPAVPVETLEDRLALARRWYAEHARAELAVPAAAEGLLLLALGVFTGYLWTL